jgi:hypothetical protein|eukprot:COSAG06_NODE_3174_length_5735_cov_17.475337_4_plen_93_part_00
MFVVVAADGKVLANMTSGVDAHMIQKCTPGSRTYRCPANSTKSTLVGGGSDEARSKCSDKHADGLSKEVVVDANTISTERQCHSPDNRVRGR